MQQGNKRSLSRILDRLTNLAHRTGAPMYYRWKGPNALKNFIEDMGPDFEKAAKKCKQSQLLKQRRTTMVDVIRLSLHKKAEISPANLEIRIAQNTIRATKDSDLLDSKIHPVHVYRGSNKKYRCEPVKYEDIPLEKRTVPFEGKELTINAYCKMMGYPTYRTYAKLRKYPSMSIENAALSAFKQMAKVVITLEGNEMPLKEAVNLLHKEYFPQLTSTELYDLCDQVDFDMSALAKKVKQRGRMRKPIYRWDVRTNECHTYASREVAAAELRISKATLQKAIQGKELINNQYYVTSKKETPIKTYIPFARTLKMILSKRDFNILIDLTYRNIPIKEVAKHTGYSIKEIEGFYDNIKRKVDADEEVLHTQVKGTETTFKFPKNGNTSWTEHSIKHEQTEFFTG